MSNSKNRESFILHVMNGGFTRAAQAFSKLVGKAVKVSNAPVTHLRHNDFSHIPEAKGDLYVLITQVIGDFSGKSYLVFNEDECQNLCVLTNHVTAASRTPEEMRGDLLTEVDNILSASVIAELSEALQAEIYGDVPVLKKIRANTLKQFIASDSHHADGGADILVANTVFHFNANEQIHPQFIWKISEKAYDLIPSERLAVK